MNDKKQIFGWAMYDWANSAYMTTVAAAVLPIFFAKVVVPPEGVAIGGTVYSATTLWGFLISLSTFIIFLTAPILGAISDFSASKKKFLMAFCYGGSLFTILLFFCGSGDVWMTMLFFLVAQIGFAGGNVFYDAFLPHIASPDKMDWVSGKGFSFGYIGGGIQFAIALVIISANDRLGIDSSLAARIAMSMAGLWWAGFSLITFLKLKETAPAEKLPEKYRRLPKVLGYAWLGIDRTFKTAVKVRRFRHLLLFLVAFMVYDDGIQTVISMATMYGTAELGLSNTVLMLTLLIIQIIGIPSALLFGKLGELLSTKTALMITLVLWSGIVIYAFFITSAAQYMALGAVVGLAMGGSQALSRSLYGSIIPAEASAEFFGFYSVFSKFASIAGPLMFGIIHQATGSSRYAILSLIAFFLTGILLLSFVNLAKAREAKEKGLF
ncbi:MAG: MFS transporter [Candidatus Latescibacterota bacterium]